MLAWTMPLLVAPFIGSLLGVLIHRLPRHLPVVLARSGCEACGARLGPLDLLPLVSYALQRGRCRYCKRAIGWFHPVIELAALGVPAWAVLACQTPQDAWFACLLGWTLLTLGWIDVEWILVKEGRASSSRLGHWIYSGREIRDLLASVGFTGIVLYGGFDGSTYGPQAQRLVAVAKKSRV